MKLVATGDWHIHNFTDFSESILTIWDNNLLRYTKVDENSEHFENAKEMSSRLLNILNGLCDMRDYCVHNDIQNVLMAGDCFHKRGTIEVTVFNYTYKILESFQECGIITHILAGNHDQVDASQQPVSSVHGFKEIANVIESPELVVVDDVEIVAIPYSKDKEFVLNSMKSLRANCKHPESSILMAHLGVTGGTVGSGMYSMKDEYTLKELMSSKFKYVVLGHYHQPQFLDYNAIYSGTPVQNSFSDELKGDDGYNGFFVIDTDKRYDITFVPIIAPRFITVNSAKELSKLDPEFLKNNYVRIKSSAKDIDEIQGVLEDLVGEDSQTLSIRMELEKEYAKEHRSDIGVSQSFEETIETYASENFGIDEEGYPELLGKGLEILSKAMVGGK